MKLCDYGVVCGGRGREGSVCPDAPAEADVLLVNTCAVRDHAEQRVLGRMGELKRYKRPGDVLGVVGCMAQRLGPKLLERVPQVDLDRKSTRLNSSHVRISYAVFCLKKKNAA